MTGLIYLFSPYSHDDDQVKEQRYDAACEYAAKLFRAGLHVFSPIAHCHGIARYGLPGGIDFWRPYCDLMLSKSDSGVILGIDGWRESDGIKHELRQVQDREFPILVCEPDELPKQKTNQDAKQIQLSGL